MLETQIRKLKTFTEEPLILLRRGLITANQLAMMFRLTREVASESLAKRHQFINQHKGLKMTLEEFKVKYKFAKNMDESHVRELMMFLMMFMMRLGSGDGEEAKEIMDEMMSVIRNR